MAGAYDRYDPLSGVYTPADLQLTNQAAAAAAASVTASSYTKIAVSYTHLTLPTKRIV